MHDARFSGYLADPSDRKVGGLITTGPSVNPITISGRPFECSMRRFRLTSASGFIAIRQLCTRTNVCVQGSKRVANAPETKVEEKSLYHAFGPEACRR
jgi:hypothetical protein